MSTFPLEIVTPEGVVFNKPVEMVTAPSADGVIGILPHHIPLATRLVEGEVKIVSAKEEIFLAIGSGYLEVTREKVMILVTAAYHADQINEHEMQQAIVRAKEVLAQAPKGEAFTQAQALFRRSTIALDVARRRRRSTVSL